jgi:AAA15 family ATPase/GTPase
VFDGSYQSNHHEIVEMELSFSAIYAAVAMMTRFRVLEPLFEIVKEIVKILDSSDNRAHNLLKCWLLEALIEHSARATRPFIYGTNTYVPI